MTKTRQAASSSPRPRPNKRRSGQGMDDGGEGQSSAPPDQARGRLSAGHLESAVGHESARSSDEAPVTARAQDAHSSKPVTKNRAGTSTLRRTPSGGQEMKPEKPKVPGKPKQLNGGGSQKSCNKSSGLRKLSDASSTSDELSKDSGCATGKLSSTDSSSEMSDFTSEENKLSTDAQCSDIETSSRDGFSDVDRTDLGHGVSGIKSAGTNVVSSSTAGNTLAPAPGGVGEGSISPADERSFPSMESRLNFSSSVAFSDLTGEFVDGMHDELVREIDDLRSENEYLKDEMEELRSEMLEMRDLFLEEDVYQLQELRHQLEQANKSCRILQYRLRKAERRSLRVAQTGQVDGELIRALEHDVRVAKSVSMRLHAELETVQKRRQQLEWENQELRERTQDLEVANQVLHNEMEKSRQENTNSLRRRSMRSSTGKPEKKLSPQDDSADLKCQLHFAKEESALMCKKLTKMASENEGMREELSKFRLLYGDVDCGQLAAAVAADGGVANSPLAREAEVKVHLRLVEEEATLLSRRIVELEVENRGLRAEMSEMRERRGGGGGGRRGGVGVVGGEDDEEFMMDGGGEHLALPVCGGVMPGQMGESRQVTVSIKDIAQVEPVTVIAKQIQTEEGFTVVEVPCSRVHIGPPEPHVTPGDTKHSPDGGQEKVTRHGSADPLTLAKELGLNDLKALLAIHNQALLVSSAIDLLRAPAQKNGLSPPSNQKTPQPPPPPLSDYLTKAESDRLSPNVPLPHPHPHARSRDSPSFNPLSGDLEVFQTQLHILAERIKAQLDSSEARKDWSPCDSTASSLESNGSAGSLSVPAVANRELAQHNKDTLALLKVDLSPGCPCDQETLVLLTLQLRWFLQQWRQGEEATDLFEVGCQKKLRLLMEGEEPSDSEEAKKISPMAPKPFPSQVNSPDDMVLMELKAAMLDLSGELQEERRAGLELAQQFARAKAAWAVERTELRGVINTLESAGSKLLPELKGAPALPVRGEHVEKLQHMLADSYAVVMELTRQMKMRERNWSAERQELLDYLQQMQMEQQHQQHGGKEAEVSAFKMYANGRGFGTPSRPKPILTEPSKASDKNKNSNNKAKNWLYVNEEAELMDQPDAHRTWDYPIMPPRFPGLNLTFDPSSRCHTAPERTSLRIYYSPPSARRVHLSKLTWEKEDAYLAEKSKEMERQNGGCFPTFTQKNRVDEDMQSLSFQTGLPLDFHDLLECSSSSSSSNGSANPIVVANGGGVQHCVFQPPQVLAAASLLHLGGLGQMSTANLSDDMKEMTASVRGGGGGGGGGGASRGSTLERGRGLMKDACSQTTQTQTQPQAQNQAQNQAQAQAQPPLQNQPQVHTVSTGMQTEGVKGVAAGGRYWSPRGTTASLVSPRAQHISSSLERVSGRVEKPPPCSTSPKLYRRHSASSPFSSSSSTTSPSMSFPPSSSLSSSSSLGHNPSRLEPPKERGGGVWGLGSQRGSVGSSWARSSTGRGGSAAAASPGTGGSGGGGGASSTAAGSTAEKTASGRKAVGIHRYGLVQEFLRNVCGRGDKATAATATAATGGTEKEKSTAGSVAAEKAGVPTTGRRDNIGLASQKKAERPSSRVTLVRHDSVTRIVNRRFMKQAPKDESSQKKEDATQSQTLSQAQSQTQSQTQTSKVPISKDKSFPIGSLERDGGACDCSARSLTSCFARPSRYNTNHAHNPCRHRPHDCPSAATVKGNAAP